MIPLSLFLVGLLAMYALGRIHGRRAFDKRMSGKPIPKVKDEDKENAEAC